MLKNKLKKAARGLLWFSGVLALLLLLLNFVINLYVGHLFKKQIDDFERNSAGFYRIEYRKPRINIFLNRITLKKFHLIPKPDLNGKPGHFNQPSSYIEAELPLLKIEGISFFKYIFFKTLNVRRIVIKGAHFKIFKSSEGGPVRKSGNIQKNIITLPLNLRSVLIKFCHFKNCSVSYVGSRNQKEAIKKFDLDFMLRNSKLDFHVLRTGHSILKPETLELTFNKIRINLPDRFYSVTIEEMGVSAPLSKIWMHLAALNPRYPKYSFSRKLGYRTDRKSLKIKWAHFHGADVADLIEKSCFQAEQLSIRGVLWEFFRNKQVPRRTGIRPKKFPQRYLRDLKVNIRVEKVKISDGFIVYEERAEIADKTAKIFFSQVKMDLENITNIPHYLSRRDDLPIRASSRFMGKTDFRVKMRLSILDRHDRFSFSGNMQSMNGSLINPILNNNAIHLESGKINRLFFQANGNRYEIRGRMRMFYNELKISLLSRRKSYKKEKLVSFFINWIIQSNNPRRRKPLRTGNMYYQRKLPKSIFNLMWKSFLAGVKSSIGLKKRKK
jgi:hypothetical protein